MSIDPSLLSIHQLYKPNVYGFRVQAFATFLVFLATELRLSPPTVYVYKYAVIHAFKMQHLDAVFSSHELLDRVRGAITIDWNANNEKSQNTSFAFHVIQAYYGH